MLEIRLNRQAARPLLETLERREVPAAIRFLPGFNANTLPRADDTIPGGTPQVGLGFQINFYGLTASSVFVNNNGNVSLGQEFTTYTPQDLNSANGGIPLIAAFFADVDTQNNASGVITYGTDILCDRRVFGVNSINVGYFNDKVNLLNSFQMILIDRSDTGAGNFDIEFNYDKIQWESGDVESPTDNGLGGISAAVGYTNGTGNPGTFFELPGSRTPGSFLDSGTRPLINTAVASNTPGRIHFLVRNGIVVQNVGTGDVTPETRTFFPFRYATDLTTLQQSGNLSLINASDLDDPTEITDACLDVVTLDADGFIFQGPITVVFNQPFAGDSRIVNATGATASGRAYITMNVANLTPSRPVLRVPLVLRNPDFDAPTSFFIAPRSQIQVIAGAFDPTLF